MMIKKSNEQTEFQIKDRLSFLDFLGLQIGDNVPDQKIIWLFKEQLKKKDLSKKLLDKCYLTSYD